MESRTEVLPLPFGPEISTERPSSSVSLIPNRFLITILVVFIDKLAFCPYNRAQLRIGLLPIGPLQVCETCRGFFILTERR